MLSSDHPSGGEIPKPAPSCRTLRLFLARTSESDTAAGLPAGTLDASGSPGWSGELEDHVKSVWI